MRALGPSTPLTFGLVKNKNKTPTSSASPTSPVSPVRAAPASPTYALSPPSPSARSFPVFPPLSPSSPAKRFFQEQTFLEPTNPEPEPTTPEPTKLEPTIPEPTILEPVKIPVIIPSIPIIMSTGTLAIKVLKVEAIHEDADANKTIQVKIKIANEIKTSKQFQVGHDVDLPLNFDLNGADADSEIVIEAHTDASKKKEKVTTMAWKVKLSQFLKHTAWVKTGLNSDHYKIHVESKFTAKNTTQKLAGEGAAHAVDQVKETAASLVTLNPQRTLAVSETHRPWFLRAAYYYDTTKNVYNYTTSFRVIAPVARFGENTANTILQKVTGKTLADLDGQLVSPSLNTIDNTVDATISTVLVKLVQGQTYVLKKKDDAVSTASGVLGSTLTTAGKAKDYTTSTVSGVVGSTLSTVGKAKDYTTSSVKSVTTSTYNTVASVTDYTSTQVVNVSSSAFGKVRGATVYLASHVPYLGAKIRA